MKRKPSAHRRSRQESGPPLESTALEAITLFAGILARCGSSPRLMAQAFAAACARIPETVAVAARRSERELREASHILTVWFSDPMYLDRWGRPLRLVARGPAPSLEALIRRIDPTLDVTEVLNYLRRRRSVKKYGNRYAPQSRAVVLRGAQGPFNDRNMRSLRAMLGTLEHNTQPEPEAPGWFERFAENPAFPKRARSAFAVRLEEEAMKLLRSQDSGMHREELKRRPGEPVVRMGVGVYRFEEEVPPAAAKPRTKRR